MQASPWASPVNPAVSSGLETAHVTLRVGDPADVRAHAWSHSQTRAHLCSHKLYSCAHARTHVHTHTHSLPLWLQVSLPQGGPLPSSAVTQEALPETWTCRLPESTSISSGLDSAATPRGRANTSPPPTAAGPAALVVVFCLGFFCLKWTCLELWVVLCFRSGRSCFSGPSVSATPSR